MGDFAQELKEKADKARQEILDKNTTLAENHRKDIHGRAIIAADQGKKFIKWEAPHDIKNNQAAMDVLRSLLQGEDGLLVNNNKNGPNVIWVIAWDKTK